jgi:hypothetical protein
MSRRIVWRRIEARIVPGQSRDPQWLPVRVGDGPAVWLPREHAHWLAKRPTWLPTGGTQR